MSNKVPVNICPEINACWDTGAISRISHIEKSGRRSRNQYAKNCSCRRCQFSLCLENSPWTINLLIPHPARASPHSWPPCKGGISPMASRKTHSKHLVTDEAEFTRDGIVNFYNTHVWMDDSSHTTVASSHQHRLSMSVWVGILGDQLLGPVVLRKRPTGAVCLCFLVNDLLVLLEHAPLHQQQHTWFMHNGAPINFLGTVREYLNHTFGEQSIGRGSPAN
jgi:hypothetical protein